jgi:hypothetical protein
MEATSMINESDIKAKPDDELLSIWANQNDYVPEMIPWVKTEIDRRHLDTNGIHVRTAAEIKDEEERESDRDFVKMVSLLQGLGGGILLMFTIPMIVERLSEYLRYQTELDIGIPFIMLLMGLLLIFYAVGVWNEKRWAIISGLIIYSIVTILNIFATILSVLTLLGNNGTKGMVMIFALNIGFTVVSVGLVLAFNRLRKRKNLAARMPS